MFDELKEVKYIQGITNFRSLIVTSYNVKYFKERKRLKNLRKKEAYLEPKRATTMELFCEYTERLTIFAIKVLSWMFDRVRPPKILKFSK